MRLPTSLKKALVELFSEGSEEVQRAERLMARIDPNDAAAGEQALAAIRKSMSEIIGWKALHAQDVSPATLSEADMDEILAYVAKNGGNAPSATPQQMGATPDPTFPPTSTQEAHAAADRVNNLLQTGRGNEVRERDFAQAMQDRQYFLQGYDLPLDHQSRMARADEYWPTEGYHYTDASVDFNYPNTDRDGGFHYGTAEAAADRYYTRMGGIPIHTSRNPYYGETLATPEGLSVVEAARNARRQLIEQGEDPSNYYLDHRDGVILMPPDQYGSGFDARWLGNDVDALNLEYIERRMENSSGMAPRTIPLRVADYDPYLAHHDPGRWSPENMAGVVADRGNTRLAEIIENNANLAYALPPEAAIQEFGQPIDLALGRHGGTDMATRAAQKAFTDADYTGVSYPNLYEGRPGSRSSMVFAPQQVRSQLSALFDPRLRHLGNISAGVGGAAIAPYVLGTPYGISDE